MKGAWLFLALAIGSFAPNKADAETFDECVAEKLAPSLSVVDQMQQAGLPLEIPREVSQLFLGTSDHLQSTRASLEALGYKVSIDSTLGRLLAVAVVPVNRNWVRSSIPEMCRASADARAQYDGWDVDVRQNPNPPAAK